MYSNCYHLSWISLNYYYTLLQATDSAKKSYSMTSLVTQLVLQNDKVEKIEPNKWFISVVCDIQTNNQ